MTEIETINPFKNNDIYSLSNTDHHHLLKIKIYHNTNIIKGISEKLISDSYVYANDYEIKNIEIISKKYYEFKERNKILFDSDELYEMLKATNISYDDNVKNDTFVKTVPIYKTTTFEDVKKGLDELITLNTFINNSITEIESSTKSIIKKHYNIALSKTD